jgi:ribonuclease BN (tRNA processing enzyme)
MQLLFLGSGSAHTLEGDNFQSNMLLVAASGRRLLIDCGSDIRWSLARRGLSYKDVTDVYVSHLHADHIGGLEHIGFQRKFDSSCKRPLLYLDESLSQPLWDHSLKGGMQLIAEGDATLETYFEVHTLKALATFEWEDMLIKTVPTMHVTSAHRVLLSYGLFIEYRGRKTFITTDTQFHPAHLQPYYSAADQIFHDCEIGPNRTGVHPHYDDLLSLPAGVKAKTRLYDYQTYPDFDVAADGFLGLVRAGETFPL